jgi:hypothetical protein
MFICFIYPGAILARMIHLPRELFNGCLAAGWYWKKNIEQGISIEE